MKNEVVLRAGDTINEFGWDNKHAGINVLISKVKFSLIDLGIMIFFYSIWLFLCVYMCLGSILFGLDLLGYSLCPVFLFWNVGAIFF